MSHNN